MSNNLDSLESDEDIRELLAENTRWLKVIAFLIGDLAGVDATGIYEDLD